LHEKVLLPVSFFDNIKADQRQAARFRQFFRIQNGSDRGGKFVFWRAIDSPLGTDNPISLLFAFCRLPFHLAAPPKSVLLDSGLIVALSELWLVHDEKDH
jgi:hypothetical protein